MLKVTRILGSQIWSKSIVALIIGALCFSLGEGLRLTPFTLAAIEPPSAASKPGVAPAATALSRNKASKQAYGPLDVPVSMQKRGKGQPPDCSGPAARTAVQPAESFNLIQGQTALKAISSWSGSQPPGRAPPSIS